MNRAHMLKKTRKLTLAYMAVLIAMSAYIIVKLLSMYLFSEIVSFKEMVVSEFDTSFFTRIVHVVNPSVAYYSEYDQEDERRMRSSQMNTLYGSSIPLVSFILSQGDYVYNATSENYSNLKKKGKTYENALDKYHHDESFFDTYTLEEQTPTTELTTYTMAQLTNFTFLQNNIYTFDPTTNPTPSDFPINKFLSADLSINRSKKGPKVLIYHTHSQESFVDSRKGNLEDTVVGVGDELARILEETYNIEVLHNREVYDIIDGKVDKSKAYNAIEAPLEKILKENPTIEVMLDIHRDGVKGNLKLVKTVEGQPTAKIMFFNGLAIYDVMPNPYVTDNLAFSFQLQLKANELYPGLARKIYLKTYRYNLHLKPKSVLIEVGAQTSTVTEAKNAMGPLAKILYEVIK